MIKQFDIVIALSIIWLKLYIKFPDLIYRLHFDSISLLCRSSMFIDGNEGTYEVDFEDIKASKADPLGQIISISSPRRWLPSSVQWRAYNCIRVESLLCIRIFLIA